MFRFGPDGEIHFQVISYLHSDGMRVPGTDMSAINYPISGLKAEAIHWCSGGAHPVPVLCACAKQ